MSCTVFFLTLKKLIIIGGLISGDYTCLKVQIYLISRNEDEDNVSFLSVKCYGCREVLQPATAAIILHLHGITFSLNIVSSRAESCTPRCPVSRVTGF